MNEKALQYGDTSSTRFSRATYRSNRPRVQLVLPWVRDRTVLDLGCGMGYQRPDGIFYQIAAAARRAIGIDLQSEIVAAYQDQGYDVRQGDVQRRVLRDEPPGQFDVVFGGEIIEHLDNFAGFFDNVSYHLKSDGVLVLSTVNAFAFPTWLRTLFNRKGRGHPEHTCWFDEVTLVQLLDRHGFRVVDLRYVHHRGHMQLWYPQRVLSRLVKLVLPDRVSWDDMVVVAARNGPKPGS